MSYEEILLLPLYSDLFPPLLKEIQDCPKQLYVRGNVNLLSHPNLLAVVGSRKAHVHSKEALDILLPPVIKAGAVIVSGLAYGVDALAHQTCVEAHSPTIAVLGGGIDDATIYPAAHRTLAIEILEAGGALVSEYPAGTGVQKYSFPRRNRIVAGLCRATLVVQAALKSGSLITARLALEYNREVLAIPGHVTDPYSAGTNYLIHEGATPVISSQDLLDILKLG
ncbi:MAG: DNA-protecting protein DprA [Candidatus Andersenbacteria bacterium]|nr:DNA-protecting protein DprA [Candidatus Andersenbacteria bacterium]MBI3251011.1 DNA-protecting protein DprA [Candidatus Andersenbacteria bacterium]